MRSYKRNVERAEMEAANRRLLLSKRRKSIVSIELPELALASPADVKLDNAITAASATSDVVFAGDKCCRLSSDEFSFSRCFSNGCCDVVKYNFRFVDLKVKFEFLFRFFFLLCFYVSPVWFLRKEIKIHRERKSRNGSSKECRLI